MKDISEENIKALLDLAEQWRVFSQETNGWTTEEYVSKDVKVRCYFADNSDHTSIRFETGGFNPRSFSVGFHSTPKVEFDINAPLSRLLETATVFLGDMKSAHATLKREEVEQKKRERLQALRRQIAELEESETA